VVVTIYLNHVKSYWLGHSFFNKRVVVVYGTVGCGTWKRSRIDTCISDGRLMRRNRGIQIVPLSP
jgi:hypothetical protein